MKLTKCENGHYYDAEKYPYCPHCSGSSGMGGGTVPFSGSGAAADQSGESVTEPFMGSPFGGGNNDGGLPTMKFTEPDVTMPMQDFSSFGRKQDEKKTQPFEEDEGKTVAYMAWKSEQQRQNIQDALGGVLSDNAPVNGRPVVGWLVCIEGSSYGKCFNIYGEKNFIGRSANMDVALTGDNTVSRSKHAIIIYDPKTKKFYAQPGESQELFYVNDEVVLQTIQLHDRDVLQIGKTSLVFVPFCDERYSWTKED